MHHLPHKLSFFHYNYPIGRQTRNHFQNSTVKLAFFFYQREYVHLGKEFALTSLPSEAPKHVTIIVLMTVVSNGVCMCIFVNIIVISLHFFNINNYGREMYWSVTDFVNGLLSSVASNILYFVLKAQRVWIISFHWDNRARCKIFKILSMSQVHCWMIMGEKNDLG